jgi:hypothetical protein
MFVFRDKKEEEEEDVRLGGFYLLEDQQPVRVDVDHEVVVVDFPASRSVSHVVLLSFGHRDGPRT